MNHITEKQNSEKGLAMLVAQRRLYSRAKLLFKINILLSVPFTIIWSLVSLYQPDLKVYAAVWGALVSFLDLLLLTPWQNSIKERAAKVQELFDCYVLEMPWDSLKAGQPPDAETITEWSYVSSGESYESMKLIDWYSREVSTLPLGIARIVCQRGNCFWDAGLRRRCAYSALTMVLALFFFIVLVGAVGHAPVDQFILSCLLPYFPVAILGTRQFAEQKQAADRLDKLRLHSLNLWEMALRAEVSESDLTIESRRLQNEILEQRKKNPLIFDSVYFLLRKDQEQSMNKTAAQLAQEAHSMLSR